MSGQWRSRHLSGGPQGKKQQLEGNSMLDQGNSRGPERSRSAWLRLRDLARGGPWWWTEARSQDFRGHTEEFVLYLEGSWEPWKVCKHRSAWKPPALSGLT